MLARYGRRDPGPVPCRAVGAACTICALALALAGCEESKEPLASVKPTKIEPVLEKKVEKAPTFSVDASGVRVGFELFIIEGTNGPSGLLKLQEEIAAQRKWVDGQEVAIEIHRKAKLPWVTTYLAALEDKGATAFAITTGTRDEYPKTVTFSALGSVKDASECSVVTMIQEGGNTATWKRSGSPARRRRPGLGGPDLSTTGATIESVAQSCKTSNTVFVSAEPETPWGLVYDLAASTAVLKEASFSRRALLSTTPVAGKAVQL